MNNKHSIRCNKLLLKATSIVVMGAFLFNMVFIDLVRADILREVRFEEMKGVDPAIAAYFRGEISARALARLVGGDGASTADYAQFAVPPSAILPPMASMPPSQPGSRSSPAAVKTGFELDPQRDRGKIVASNREYLQSKELWTDELDNLGYDTLFILEDDQLQSALGILIDLQKDALERTVVASAIAKIAEEGDIDSMGEMGAFSLLTMGMAVASGEANPRRIATTIKLMMQLRGNSDFDIQIPSEEQAITLIRQNIVSLAHFLQGVYFYSLDDSQNGQRAFERARATKVDAGISNIFVSDAISDALYIFANPVYFKGNLHLYRRCFTFSLARSLYNPELPHKYVPSDYASDLALLQGLLHGASGFDMIETLLTLNHGDFSAFAVKRAAVDDPMGRGLRNHYEQTKKETLVGSSYVTEQGAALVLGAGSFVVLPLVEMLRETLPDGKTLKYNEIILIELGVDLTKNARQRLIDNGTISEEEAKRIRVIRGDATSLLAGLTSRINEIIQQRLQSDEPRKAPSEDFSTFFQEIADPAQLAKYATPIEGQSLTIEPINFVVFAMAIQDFASPIRDYVEVWSRLFKRKGDEALAEAFKQWNAKAVQTGIAGIVLQYLSRVIAPSGIVFLGDVTGIAKDESGEERILHYFYDQNGLSGLIPRDLPYEVIHRSQWIRPLNEEGTEQHFVVESLVIQKTDSSGSRSNTSTSPTTMLPIPAPLLNMNRIEEKLRTSPSILDKA